jgi:hypothetical protein
MSFGTGGYPTPKPKKSPLGRGAQRAGWVDLRHVPVIPDRLLDLKSFEQEPIDRYWWGWAGLLGSSGQWRKFLE